LEFCRYAAFKKTVLVILIVSYIIIPNGKINFKSFTFALLSVLIVWLCGLTKSIRLKL
jgi:hypothetical protein